jgi:hypothetical protein
VTNIDTTIHFMRQLQDGGYSSVKMEMHQITALLDEIDRLRKVIADHNAECLAQCGARQLAGPRYCPMRGYRRNCSDCPKDGMVEVATSEAGAAQPQEGAQPCA